MGLVVGPTVAASALVPSCSVVVIDGISWQQCGST